MKRIRIAFSIFFILSLFSVINVTNAKEYGTPPPSNQLKKPYVKSIKLNLENLSMAKNSKFHLKVYNVDHSHVVQFESSNENVVSIQESNRRSAKLCANNIGNATITVTVQDGQTVSTSQCNVKVRPPAISVKFKSKKVKMLVGTSRKIAAVVKPNNAKELPRYISNNEFVASVSSNGKVTVLSSGKARITAFISNGKSASFLVVGKNPKRTALATPSKSTPSKSK